MVQCVYLSTPQSEPGPKSSLAKVHTYLTQSAFKVVLQKSTHPPIRQRILYFYYKVFLKSFCDNQFPHKIVNAFFILVIVKDKLTDLRGSWLLQNSFRNTLYEITTFTLDGEVSPPSSFLLSSLELSDTKVYAPTTSSLLRGTAGVLDVREA